MKNQIMIMLFFLCSVGMFSQQRTIMGKVVDNDNQPLLGVNIIVKNTTNGTQTDFDGNFALQLNSEQETIVVSYLSFETLEINVKGKSKVIIQMTPSTESLDEIVVVGYGTQKVKDITGSVAVFDGDAVAEKKTTQVSTALQGSIAGVTVSRSSGAPGSSGSILIRGITSLGNSSPLVLIDGVPGGIDDVNPDDIKNISVLKDAASAAIYGSRAAAGVILITTKRAKEGKASFTYNTDAGFQYLGDLPEFTDAQTYMTLYNEMRINDGQNEFYTEDEIQNWTANNRIDPDGYPITDWNDTFFSNSAFQTRHNFSVSVGADKLKSKASVGWVEQGALTPNRNYKRLNLRLNNNYDFSEIVSALFDISYKRTITRSPSQGTDIYQVFRLAPIWDDYYEDGRYAPARTGNNPYANSVEGGNVDKQFNSFSARLGLVLKPVEGLTFRAIVAPSIGFDRETNFRKLVNYGEALDPNQIVFTSGGTENYLREKENKSEKLNLQVITTYDFDINEIHKIGITAGFEDNRYEEESLTVGRDGYTFLDYPVINSGSEEIQTTGGGGYETALRSYFGRVTYNYNDKYHLQFNARYDGSSRFHEDHRWGFFPSVAAAWTISEENFAKGFFKENYMKIRASWGRLGNQRIGNYPYISEITLGDNLFYDGENIVPLTTGDIRNLAVEDISWETTETYNIGVDLKLLNNRLSITADGYKKNTYDLLRKIPVPDYIGLGDPTQNIAEIETYGWDAGVNWKDRIGDDFKYRVGLNITDSKTDVVDLAGTSVLNSNALIEDEEYNIYYGYRALGFLTQEDIDNGVALVNGNEKPGDMRYMDLNGDGVITADGDREPLESSRSRYVYGGNLGFDFKGFDFNASFQGVAKRKRYYSSFMTRPFIGETGNIPEAIVGNYWTPENTDAEYPRLSNRNGDINYRLSDYWLRSAAYFRISNVTLGYTLPKDVIKGIGLSSIRVYVTGNDVLLVTEYPKGFDPEIGITSSPIASTYLLGLNVKF